MPLVPIKPLNLQLPYPTSNCPTLQVVTLNSDDPAYFGGYLLDNYPWVQKLLGLDIRGVARLAGVVHVRWCGKCFTVDREMPMITAWAFLVSQAPLPSFPMTLFSFTPLLWCPSGNSFHASFISEEERSAYLAAIEEEVSKAEAEVRELSV